MQKTIIIKKATLIFMLVCLIALGEVGLFFLNTKLFSKAEDPIGIFQVVPSILAVLLLLPLFKLISEVMSTPGEKFL